MFIYNNKCPSPAYQHEALIPWQSTAFYYPMSWTIVLKLPTFLTCLLQVIMLYLWFYCWASKVCKLFLPRFSHFTRSDEKQMSALRSKYDFQYKHSVTNWSFLALLDWTQVKTFICCKVFKPGNETAYILVWNTHICYHWRGYLRLESNFWP